jgi:hypothetical protein
MLTDTTGERDSLTGLAQLGRTLDSRYLADTPIPLWEWTITRDETGASAGICDDEHSAIQAIAQALTRAGRPRAGQVTSVLLIDSVHQGSYYLRGAPQHTAVFDGKAIQWT